MTKIKTIQEMPKQPRYSVGQTLQLKSKTLYDEVQGTVSSIERKYQRISKFTGKFDPHGLTTLEGSIKSISLPYEFDGETLIVTYNDGNKETSKFSGYAYTIKTPKMNSVYSEGSLSDKLIAPVVNNEPRVTCPMCKGKKTISVTVHEGKKESSTNIECITCHGEGTCTTSKAASHEHNKNAWCKCKDPKVWNNPRHERSGGQDYYYCRVCTKLLQVG